MNVIPPLPIGQWVAAFISLLQNNLLPLFNFIRVMLEGFYSGLVAAVTSPGTLGVLVIAGALGWLARGWKFGLFSLVGFTLVASMGLWEAAMQTLSQVLIATLIAVLLSIPLGILAARSEKVSAVVRPVLDFMQTLPPFVYLVPAVIFFGIGAAAGTVATIIFAMPPGVRLTELGIRQVDKEMVEAGEAFGAPPRQILTRIQVPLAMPTIMAGVNQIIMLSLSMVVLAGIVGAPGLGQEIYGAVQQILIGSGFEAGFAVVVIAIFLDRLTGAFSSAQQSSRRSRMLKAAGLRKNGRRQMAKAA